MLIVFKSAASGDIITFEKNAREMLDVLGKDRDEGKGVPGVHGSGKMADMGGIEGAPEDADPLAASGHCRILEAHPGTVTSATECRRHPAPWTTRSTTPRVRWGPTPPGNRRQ